MPAGNIRLLIQQNPQQFTALMQAIEKFSPELAKYTTKRLVEAGDATVKDMRALVLAAGHGPTREKVAAGIKVDVITGSSKQGVELSSTGTMPMSLLLNKPTWRHPVFGHRKTWVAQRGTPYFGQVIKRHEDKFREAVLDALGDAVEEMSKK